MCGGHHYSLEKQRWKWIKWTKKNEIDMFWGMNMKSFINKMNIILQICEDKRIRQNKNMTVTMIRWYDLEMVRVYRTNNIIAKLRKSRIDMFILFFSLELENDKTEAVVYIDWTRYLILFLVNTIRPHIKYYLRRSQISLNIGSSRLRLSWTFINTDLCLKYMIWLILVSREFNTIVVLLMCA